MKLALICDGPVPHDHMNYRGEALIRLLPGENHTVYLVCPRPQGSQALGPLRHRVVRYHYGSYRFVLRSASLLMRTWQLMQLIHTTERALKHPVDLIRTVSLFPTVAAILAQRRRRHAPVVANLSDFYSDLYAGGRLPLPALAAGLIRQLERICTRADFIIVDTDEQRDRWVSRGVAPSRCAAIPHGLPRSWHSSTEPGEDEPVQQDVASAATAIFYVGDIGEMDGIDILLRALSVLKERGRSPRLLLVGVGTNSYMRELKVLGQQLNLWNQVEHIPQIPNRSLPRLMTEANVCVAPFRLRETSSTSIPNKVLEYLTTQKPIVVPKGSALERLFGETFIYFDAEDPESLANAIEKGLGATAKSALSARLLRQSIQGRLAWKPIIDREWALLEAASSGTIADAGIFDYSFAQRSAPSIHS